jgi:hypothetical protein
VIYALGSIFMWSSSAVLVLRRCADMLISDEMRLELMGVAG